MSTSLPLPPSARDFLAYSRIVVDSASTRAVADELHISQTRVRQVVKRVCDWMHQSLPAQAEADDAARIRVAQHIAADRLQHFYGEANRLWHQTGEMKYANLAIKVMLAQTKLPALPGTLEALALDAIYGPLDDSPDCTEHDTSGPNHRGAGLRPAATSPDSPTPPPTPTRRASEDHSASTTTTSSSAPPTNSLPSFTPSLNHSVPPTPNSLQPTHSAAAPPPRACSPSQPSPPAINNQPPSAITLTPESQTLSTAPPKFQSAVRKAFFDPAHHLLNSANPTAATELRITPQTHGLGINTPLNRSARRRLRRLATR